MVCRIFKVIHQDFAGKFVTIEVHSSTQSLIQGNVSDSDKWDSRAGDVPHQPVSVDIAGEQQIPRGVPI